MKTIVAVLASTFLITGAYAQSPARSVGAPPSPDASTAPMMKSDAKRDMKVETHIKDLHAKLKITPAEESQWAAVVQTMRDNATELDKAIDKREAIVNNATAIDDLNAYGDIAQAHADGVKKLSTAFSPLYASMSDDQKKVADELFGHRVHEGKKISKATK
jgi:periplasmic protein CpxP/Spy